MLMKSESLRCSHVWYMTHAKKSPTAWGTIPPNVGFHSPRQGGDFEHENGVFRHSGYYPWIHGKFICKGEGKWRSQDYTK